MPQMGLPNPYIRGDPGFGQIVCANSSVRAYQTLQAERLRDKEAPRLVSGLKPGGGC